MKKIVSVSLGSSKRDHKVYTSFLGRDFEIIRRGTDGNFKHAISILKELDGQVDAIGLGGIDIYLYSKNKRYSLRDGLRLKNSVKKTPLVDGSSLK
ncbi:MAG TPA: quinate 5-dehydrogenase, partial [Candidatus Eremiobacteraeota bacterium]|nr:quinate 5-dehydrogenase [Candidatus Eremiobacteraeota bacterium]